MPKYSWLAILALVLLWGYGLHEHQVGSLHQRIAQLEQHKSQVDSVYVHDTLTLTKVRIRTDSLLRVDTLIRVDTVRQIIAAERLACNQVVQTCEQRVAVRDSLIRELKKKPSVLSKLPWLVGGYLLHEAIH